MKVQIYLAVVRFHNVDVSFGAFHFCSLEAFLLVLNPDPFLALERFTLFQPGEFVGNSQKCDRIFNFHDSRVAVRSVKNTARQNY